MLLLQYYFGCETARASLIAKNALSASFFKIRKKNLFFLQPGIAFNSIHINTCTVDMICPWMSPPSSSPSSPVSVSAWWRFAGSLTMSTQKKHERHERAGSPRRDARGMNHHPNVDKHRRSKALTHSRGSVSCSSCISCISHRPQGGRSVAAGWGGGKDASDATASSADRQAFADDDITSRKSHGGHKRCNRNALVNRIC